MLLPLSSMPVAFVRYFGILWIMTCLCKHLSALCDRRKWGCNKCKYSWINSILIYFLKPWLMCLLLLLLFLFEWTWYGEMKHSTWHKLKIMDVFESQGSSWWYPVRDQDQAAFSLLVESHEFWFWFFLFLFFFKKKKQKKQHTIDFAFSDSKTNVLFACLCTTLDVPCNISQSFSSTSQDGLLALYIWKPRILIIFFKLEADVMDFESPMLRVFMYTFSLTGLTSFKD